MIKKKICLLGYFAVGKTSLVQRYVFESFSEKYLTTIGVKIDKKELTIDDRTVQLIIWDIHGEDRFQKVQQSYLVGASGYFLVVDASRKESLSVALDLKKLMEATVGEIPFLVLLNKSDLIGMLELSKDDLIAQGIQEDDIIATSAKTGQGVEDAFYKLTERL